MKASRSVVIHCVSPLRPPLQVDWFWAKDSDQDAEGPMSPNANVVMQGKTERKNAYLWLKDVSPSDSGIYYCKVNGSRGPGTGLQVMRESLWALVPGGPSLADPFAIQSFIRHFCLEGLQGSQCVH